MNKYTFIKDLLENNKLNPSQKDRFLKLVSNELSLAEEKDNQIIQDINLLKKEVGLIPVKQTAKKDRIEQQVSYNDDNFKTEEKKVVPSNLPIYIDPKQLYKFLLAYNQDPILKTTCHLIDQNELDKIINIIGGTEYSYQKHLEKIIESYNVIEEKYFVNYRVKALIRGYLTGKNYKNQVIKSWSGDKIDINWNSLELIEWSKNNIGIPPNPDEDIVEKLENIGFEFNSFHSSVTNNQIKTLSELVIHFKYLFHLRSDNSLKEMIKKININEGWDEIIDFDLDHDDFWNNLELFTDVDKLKQAYEKIIRLIIEVQKRNNQEKPKVRLSFKELNNEIVFSIHHINSVYKKTVSNTLDKIGQAYFNLISKQINGLCDLKLKADFGNKQFAVINLWDGKPRKKTLIEKFPGVEHILIFKK